MNGSTGWLFDARRMAVSSVMLLILFSPLCQAQQAALPAPTYPNVAYGPHKKHVLDFWKAESSAPTPLVLYIHGGAFTGGKKESIPADTLKSLLDAKISVAAIEYRVIADAPLPAAHEDAVRALQFLRSKASEWNIDKKRVGAFGGSAGAQLCMYLAFKDDQAKPGSADPVQRESSRLACVATYSGQTTRNLDLWVKWIPGLATPPRDPLVDFGVKTKEEYLAKAALVSALDLVSADDPPIFMTYRMAPGDPIPEDPKKMKPMSVSAWQAHHVIFGIKLKEKMDALGVEADLDYPGAKTKYPSIAQFLITKLTK